MIDRPHGVHALAHRIGIEPGEGRIFVYAAAVLFLIGWSDAQLTNASETLFLKRVGVEYLPLVFLANSLLLVGTTWTAGRLAARGDQVRLLVRTLAVLAGTLVPLWIGLRLDVPGVLPLLVIAAKQLEAIALLVFWVALGGLLHGRQAKRLFAPMAAGATLGGICGSFASGPLGHALGIAALVPLAATSLALGAVAAAPLRSLAAGPRLARARRRPAARARREVEPARATRLWRRSLLFRVLVGSAALSGILGPMLYFQFSYVADLATQGSNGEQRLLDLYAQFRGWINFAILLLQVAGSSRLYGRIGVPLASALSPLVYLLGFVGLSVRLSLPAGIGAMAATSLQDHAVYDPAQRVLLTLFNERARATVAALAEGMKRAGGALGNLAVLATLALGTPRWVGWTALPIAAAWLALALALWRAYPSLLLEVVSARRDEDDELPVGTLVDAGTLRLLESSLADPDRERCRAACGLLLEMPPDRAAPALVRALPAAPPGNRPAIVAALADLLRQQRDRLPVPTDGVRALAPLLDDPGALAPRDRAQLVRVYAALAGPLTAPDLLARLGESTNEAVRLAAAVARDDGVDDALAAAMASADAGTREVARDALADLLARTDPGDPPDARWHARLALLATGLENPDDRAGAAAALADLAERHGTRLAGQADLLRPHTHDPDSRVRIAILRFVGHARLTDHAPWLVERLTARDDREAAAAREALRAIGPLAMDLLLQALHFGRRSTRLALLPILREIPVDGRHLRSLVDAELACMQRTVVQLAALAHGGVSDLVLQRLRERVAESAHTTLLLLAALLDEERIARLCRLLARTTAAGRERAVLLEALEALLPPADRARIMHVLEERAAPAAAPPPSARPPSLDEALREVLHGDDPLSQAFLSATLDPATRARLGVGRVRVAAPGEPVAAVTGLATGTATVDDLVRDGVDATPGDRPVLSRVEVVLHLRSLDLFGRLTTRQLTDLAGVVREETRKTAEPIVREGEVDDCMYLIVAGRVRITKGGRFLADLGPRDFFGEIAVFDGETRSATATAIDDARVLRLERHDLFLVMEEQPGIAIAICQTLSRRVRELNERVPAPAEAASK